MAYDDEAFNNALIQAGIGMMSGRGNAWEKLAQGFQGGMYGYSETLSAREKKKLQEAKLEEERQQAEQRKLAMQKMQMELERQQRLASLMNGASVPQAPPPGSQRSVVDAPGWTPQVPQSQGNDREKMIRMLADAGFVKEAEDQIKIMQGLEGKAHGNIEVDRDGKPFYMTDRGPRYTTGGFVPREKLVEVDLGGQKGFRTEYDPTIRARVDKTMTLEGADASRRGWANFGLDQQRFNRGELTDAPLPGGGTAKGYASPQGFTQLPGTGVKAPDVPSSVVEAIAKNEVALSKIDQALEEVKTRPQSFGAKNYLGDAVRQRTDSEGVRGRALVADLGSQKLHDRSGAAVTAAETPRLLPFIPTATDNPEAITKKLENFRNEYAQMNEELRRGKSIAQVSGRSQMPMSSGGRTPSIAEIQAEMLRRGIRP